MTLQKETFLTSEGDAWFERNESALKARDWSTDPVCQQIRQLAQGRPLRVLEIGCGDGSRLHHLQTTQLHKVSGVDPSGKAVERAVERGVDVKRATADVLPFTTASFDVVVFGFCLYVCDDRDLFRVASEADRVLADSGWLLILDFDAPAVVYRPYHHAAGVMSRKMDYKSMFLWHPAYTLAAYQKSHHHTHQWTDDAGDWISLSCMRKHQRT
jgi:SAM-dependent methyltransferase